MKRPPTSRGAGVAVVVVLLSAGLTAQQAPAPEKFPQADGHAPAAKEKAATAPAGTRAPTAEKAAPAGAQGERAEPAHAAQAKPVTKPRTRASVAASGPDPQLIEAADRIRSRLETLSIRSSGRRPTRAAAASKARGPAGGREPSHRLTLRWRFALEWPEELVASREPSPAAPRVP